MERSTVNMFLTANGNKFNPSQLNQVRNILASADEDRYLSAVSIELKDPTIMLIISVLVGALGIDRFMLGETGLGVAKLLTGGGCGIWTIIDWFTIQDRTKDYNFQLFSQIMS